MPDGVVGAAPWIALLAGIAASAAVAWMAGRTWHDWRRARVTQQAATALIDVHMADLDRALQQLDEHAGAFADDGERLAESLAELRADVAHLRWIVGRVPDAQDRLASELYELVLPTGGARRGNDDA